MTEQFFDFFAGQNDTTVSRYLTSSSMISEISTVFTGKHFEPQVISGRYFKQDDSYRGKNLCVLGRDFELSSPSIQHIYEAGKEVVVYNGIHYEVIGHIGYGLSSPRYRITGNRVDILPTSCSINYYRYNKTQ